MSLPKKFLSSLQTMIARKKNRIWFHPKWLRLQSPKFNPFKASLCHRHPNLSKLLIPMPVEMLTSRTLLVHSLPRVIHSQPQSVSAEVPHWQRKRRYLKPLSSKSNLTSLMNKRKERLRLKPLAQLTTKRKLFLTM